MCMHTICTSIVIRIIVLSGSNSSKYQAARLEKAVQRKSLCEGKLEDRPVSDSGLYRPHRQVQ